MIVVDAGVAIRRVFDGPDRDGATELLIGGAVPLAPEPLRGEGTGAIVRAGRIEVADASCSPAPRFGRLDDGTDAMTSDRADVGRAAEPAARLRHPLADRLYFALAERQGAGPVTAGRGSARRALDASTRVRPPGA